MRQRDPAKTLTWYTPSAPPPTRRRLPDPDDSLVRPIVITLVYQDICQCELYD